MLTKPEKEQIMTAIKAMYVHNIAGDYWVLRDNVEALVWRFCEEFYKKDVENEDE